MNQAFVSIHYKAYYRKNGLPVPPGDGAGGRKNGLPVPPGDGVGDRPLDLPSYDGGPAVFCSIRIS